MGRIPQHLIATKLGLSVATVSRSLAGHPSISTQTRRQVLEAAAALGYSRTPARTARGSSGLRKIGVLVGIQPNSSPLATYPAILNGLQRRASEDQFSIEVSYEDPNHFDADDPQNPVVAQLERQVWCGLVLIYPFPVAAVEALARRTPVLSVLETYPTPQVDSIDTNHYAGVAALVDRLVQAGHRRIGFVSWKYPTSGQWALHRFSAYAGALFRHGLELRPEWIFNMHAAHPTVGVTEIPDQVVRRLREDGVTAWVCAADHQGYQLIMDLRSRGLRVPQDCSITGFDGIDPPHGLAPMATQAVPNEVIGGTAFATLQYRIDHPKAHQRKMLVETVMIEGQSIMPIGELGERAPPRTAR